MPVTGDHIAPRDLAWCHELICLVGSFGMKIASVSVRPVRDRHAESPYGETVATKPR